MECVKGTGSFGGMLVAGICTSLLFSGAVSALEFTLYGSARIHGESVSPDDDTTMSEYSGLRDAYSRLGVKANYEIDGGTTLYGHLEIPLDLVNGEIQDPWNHDEHFRLAKVGVKGDYGNLAIGQMWMPYYNAVAYPVDMFSSYYSGFATFTSFRLESTVAYYTPVYKGFSAGFAYSDDNDLNDQRMQSAISYSRNGVVLSMGIDDLGGDNHAKIFGASVAWQVTDQFYIGAKFEEHDSDLNTGYGADGDIARNIYAGYSLGRNTFKAMLAHVDAYGEGITHVGWDYQFNDDLRLFVEYYDEEETAALTVKKGGEEETCWACKGGHSAVIGVRYDFSN